ncbi:hypothetical protein ASE17_06505 [Phenylobacterium sp. Root77]|jgi:hypothetical protein|uniref:hypothetical protein n=1 Tax=unclassified Phenylobacterium TaxID=2640670 RepID=UPI0006FDE2B0|nr:MULTISPECIES: hypothetical protein [unclassified Phenylobacterium]KQW68106.1 hypothetical protein ASC73_16410 [Phenylobacterium sp. Root1277]KQW91849.1 hypothetical protein ASC79_09785 [Phenylobacterium sp. Root1290]KRC40080.1 hypothetical protein ASE17_06505 [Phenylobacterium sp. Root77]
MIWQSMENAPQDGREILALVEGATPMVVYWSEWLEGHWQPLGHPWRETSPTRWAPLPPPP